MTNDRVQAWPLSFTGNRSDKAQTYAISTSSCYVEQLALPAENQPGCAPGFTERRNGAQMLLPAGNIWIHDAFKLMTVA